MERRKEPLSQLEKVAPLVLANPLLHLNIVASYVLLMFYIIVLYANMIQASRLRRIKIM